MFRKATLSLCTFLLCAGIAMAADNVKPEESDTSTIQTVEKASVTKVKKEIQNKNNSSQIDKTTNDASVNADKTKKSGPVQATVIIISSNPSSKSEPKKTVEPISVEPINEPVKISHERKIVVNLASRLLTLYEGNTKIRMYPVGVGKVSTPTPTGYYKVIEKSVNPVWTDPDDTKVHVESGEANPLGYRWIGYNGTYGIHGTNKPYSIGGYVSNGCTRLHEEDVEDLYSLVTVGTPVEIIYDRIVIDRDTDHTISYYIYPDGYGWQPLSIEAVRKTLAGYGVDTFESDNAISDKINASDGEPTYVAKAYSLYVNRKKLAMKALQKDNIMYLPAVAVADAVDLDLKWDSQSGLLTSPYGQACGYVKQDVVYCNAKDALTLFHLKGVLNKNFIYELTNGDITSK